MKNKFLLFFLFITMAGFLSMLLIFYLVTEDKINNPFQEKVYTDVSDIEAEHLNEYLYEIKGIVTNMGDSYVSADLTIVVSKKSSVEELKLRHDFIKSDLIKIFNQLNSDSVKKDNGLSKVEKQITNKINKQMEDGEVLNTYFTSFIIQ